MAEGQITTPIHSKPEELLELAISLGYRLQMSGAEIYRVEEAVNRLLAAYGVPGDVFAIPSCLIVTVCPDGAEPMTRMRRIGYHGTDIDAIEQYYALCRRLCQEKPDLDTASGWIREIKEKHRSYSIPALYGGYFLATGAFAMFFGAPLTDSLFSGLCGMLVGFFLRLMDKLRVNSFFKTITASFLIAIISQTLTHFSLIRYADAAAIGALMLLVPGLTFTESMRDIIYGDTLSGINRLVQVLLTAAALLLGTGAALRLAHVLWDSTSIGIALRVPWAGWIQCAAGAVACMGFCILNNIRMPGVFICMAGGGFGWAVYLFVQWAGGSSLFAYFISAAAISLYAEVMARIRKFPSFSYLVIALLPAVPGAGVYYTVEYLLSGKRAESLAEGINTASIAGLLAVGVLLVSSLFRMWTTAKQLRGEGKQK